MTLRVTLEIVPFGEEQHKRTIDVFNISNIGKAFDPNYHIYVVERNEYKTGSHDLLKVFHKREDGSLVLVKKVLEAVLDTEE